MIPSNIPRFSATVASTPAAASASPFVPPYILNVINSLPRSDDPEQISRRLMRQLPNVGDLYIATRQLDNPYVIRCLLADSRQLRNYLYVMETDGCLPCRSQPERIPLSSLADAYGWVMTQMPTALQEACANMNVAQTFSADTAEIAMTKLVGMVSNFNELSSQTQHIIVQASLNYPHIRQGLPAQLRQAILPH